LYADPCCVNTFILLGGYLKAKNTLHTLIRIRSEIVHMQLLDKRVSPRSWTDFRPVQCLETSPNERSVPSPPQYSEPVKALEISGHIDPPGWGILARGKLRQAGTIICPPLQMLHFYVYVSTYQYYLVLHFLRFF